MDFNLINKLQEASPFVAVSPEEGKERRANRPPKVLRQDEFPIFLSVVVCDDPIAVIEGKKHFVGKMGDAPDVFGAIMDGIKLIPKDVSSWAPHELLSYMRKRYNADKSPESFKAYLIDAITDHAGEYFTDIEGVV